MQQLSLFSEEPTAWSVADLNRYIKDLMDSDRTLQDIWVRGEVSNASKAPSGHFYFTLKDDKASVKCVMWKNAAMRVRFLPRDGDAVEVNGSVSVYETGGQYQVYATLIRQAGEGLLFQEFMRLKARLEAEGLFDEARKRPLPERPHTIGIVTSPTGAALQDILNTIRRRYPLAEVVVAPTLVQGDQAAPLIAASLQALNQFVRPDVIILARGGGSIEDLWAFNEEIVARAIVASTAPVVSGVGHQTDFTIADFAADLRAPTPTAAAELVTPDQDELRQRLDSLQAELGQMLLDRLGEERWTISALANRLRSQSPVNRLRAGRQRVDELATRLGTACTHRLEIQRLQLRSFAQRLEAANPLAVLGRGFALVHGPDGKIVRSVQHLHPGDRLAIQLSDGSFLAQVVEEPSHE